MAKSYGMPRADLFFRVILPGALPSIFVGLRYALGIMWLTLIVAEMKAWSRIATAFHKHPVRRPAAF